MSKKNKTNTEENISFGTMDVLAIATTVADIGLKVLPLFLGGAKKAGVGSVTVGPTEWYSDGVHIKVKNASQAPIHIIVSEALPEQALHVEYGIDAGAATNADEIFGTGAHLSDGNITIGSANAPQTMPGNPVTKAIAFSIVSLSLGVTANIWGGLRFEWGRTNAGNKYLQVNAVNPPVTPIQFNATVGDSQRASVSFSASLGKSKKTKTPGPTTESSWVLEIPDGLEDDPVSLDFWLNIYTDDATYRQITSSKNQKS